MNFGTERNRERWERMTPEQRAAVERIRALHRTPEYRAEEERIRELVREEFPPLAPDPELAATLAALRAERERQGLSLTDITERTRIDQAVLSGLETGRIPSPNYQTVRAYAKALGKKIAWTLSDDR